MLAIFPIVAVTAIVIFLLIGVFRGYRESDMGDLPLEMIMKGLGGDGAPATLGGLTCEHS